MRRASFIVLALLAVAIGVSWGVYLNQQSFKAQVHFTSVVPGSIAIYKDLGGDGAYTYNSSQPPVATVKSGQTIDLKKGVYDAVINDTQKQYKDNVIQFTVASAKNEISINPAYSQTKLASLLPAARPEAMAAITKSNPGAMAGYTVGADQVVSDGTWYVAVLKPKNTNFDVLKVIAHKEGSNWVVAATPSISIGRPSHPAIPLEVITAADLLPVN